jgi:hypothetical protein
MTAIEVVAEDLPAIPFEWNSNSRGLYYTAVSPAEIFYYDFNKRRASLIHQGLFPRISADGSLLALIDGHNVIVVQVDDPAVVVASQTVKGNPGWLSWKPDAQILAFTEELQLWRAHVNLLSIENQDVVTVFDTSRVKNLNWFKQQPGWLQYDANQGSTD